MAKICFSHLLFFLFIFYLNIGSVESSMARPRHTSQPGVKTFIEVSCQTTCYLAQYIKYLARYTNSSTQNKQQLAQVALTISFYKARYTRPYMSKVAKELESIKDKDYPAVRDCLQQIDDNVSHLSQSIRELRRCNPKTGITDDVFWHIDNVDTWISAALMDASSCAEVFPGYKMTKMKATIKGKVISEGEINIYAGHGLELDNADVGVEEIDVNDSGFNVEEVEVDDGPNVSPGPTVAHGPTVVDVEPTSVGGPSADVEPTGVAGPSTESPMEPPASQAGPP
ncbi:hypothetical protein V6N13_071045 [Hibiscus sabdariffa]|uniref:Pectinesterase inhibitor domain-containing protein n=1 Tax=Hibiscus sabdariffa TaxID=183260 RepID=A0ABR2TFI4_9ROSI